MLRETGLEYWSDAAGADVSPAAVARLLDDPKFEDVMRRAISSSLAFCDAEPAINITFQDIGTFGLGVLALALDAGDGITHRKLAEVGNRSTILSSGRASAILGLLRAKGLVNRAQGAQPGGQVRYLPSDHLTHFFKTRMKIDFSALAIVEPALNPFLDQWDAPGIFPRFVGRFGTAVSRASRRPIAALEPLAQIGAHRAGYHILYDLIARADGGGPFPSTDPFKVSVSEIARRFSVARSHVRQVIGKLESRGFLARDRDTDEYSFLPALQSSLKQLMATAYVSLMACAHEAMQPPQN